MKIVFALDDPNKQDLKTIVVAWITKTGMEKTGRTVMRDLNYFPEFKATWEGKAAMWKNKGTPEDLAKAKSYASSQGYRVYTFPTSEGDPLGKAKAMALREMPKVD
jgi:hypothetical protein